ncbi:hypothetical protein IC582_024519 [Cucumis melo]
MVWRGYGSLQHRLKFLSSISSLYFFLHIMGPTTRFSVQRIAGQH